MNEQHVPSRNSTLCPSTRFSFFRQGVDSCNRGADARHLRSEGHNQLPVLPIVEPTPNVQQFRVPPKAQRKVFSGLPAESVLR
jgi:hypothetical protein